MMMRASLSRRQRLKFGVVCAQFSFHRGEIERFEVERDIAPVGTLWKALALAPPHDREDSPLSVIGEEVLQSNTENQGDAQERREGGIQLAALDLREHGRGKSCVAPQLDQSNLLFQPQRVQLFTDGVAAQTFCQRL